MQRPQKPILLVEDDDAHAELITRAFELHGSPYRISIAKSVREAKSILSSQAIKLVIADLILPDGRGTELLNFDRMDQCILPLVVMTSHGNESVAVDAIRSGALDYVVKTEESFLGMPRTAQRALREWEHISHRRSLEQQLAQAQKMESIGRLAGGIAHDFNNLLTIILGFADIAATEVEADSGALNSIGQIREAAERACELTRQLMTFARKGPIEQQSVDFSELLNETERLLGPLIGEKIELVVGVANNLPPVAGDPGQLQQVLVNMAVNAKDAMPDSGRLTIRAESAPWPDASREGAVRIDVTDTGVGMTPEVAQQVFEPFFTTKESGKGTGLGLATCYGIIKQHGGQIEVRTFPGKGTTFSIYLPIAQQAQGRTRDDSTVAKPLPTGTETILVVEDESLVRALTTRILKSLNYNVLQAVDGEEALHVCEKHGRPVDLLLTDVMMPRVGGFELAQRLLEKHPDLKVLFVSGYSDNVELQEDVASEKAAFLHKPYTRSALAKKVRQVIDG